MGCCARSDCLGSLRLRRTEIHSLSLSLSLSNGGGTQKSNYCGAAGIECDQEAARRQDQNQIRRQDGESDAVEEQRSEGLLTFNHNFPACHTIV